LIDLHIFATTVCRRDAYTVIAPDEEKHKMLQESKITFILPFIVIDSYPVSAHLQLNNLKFIICVQKLSMEQNEDSSRLGYVCLHACHSDVIFDTYLDLETSTQL